MSQKVYGIITDKIIGMLDKGIVPWKQSWTNSAALGSHKNLISQADYRGINAFMTACVAIENNYAHGYWLTYNQATDLGGTVRKGEKGTPIVYYSTGTKQDEKGEDKKFGFAKFSTVFNVAQIDCPGLEKILAKYKTVKPLDFNPIDACDALLAMYSDCPPIHHTSDKAFYRPRADSVHMPAKQAFNTAENYYSVLFHELSHSTGHGTRLARTSITRDAGTFGDHEYSKEELIAEMGAAFLCAHSGIETHTIESSAAYIQSWLKVLKGDPKMVLQAAGQAQKATEWILGVKKAEAVAA